MKLVSKLIVFIALSLSFVSLLHAQNINEIPIYGGKPKSPELLKADQVFINKAIETSGSREKAAKITLQRGWEGIEKNDPNLAIKRFNQAWLLTPNDGHIYWGFAAATGAQGEFDESIKFFDKANSMLPNNSRLLCDFGFTYIWKGRDSDKSPKDAVSYYNKAISLFDAASTLDPMYERIFSNWAIVLFYKQDYKGAWEKVKQAESLGGKSLDSNFINDLSKKLKRPL